MKSFNGLGSAKFTSVLRDGFSGGVWRSGGHKRKARFGFGGRGAGRGRAAHVLFAGVLVNLVVPTGVVTLEQGAVQKQATSLAGYDLAFDF